MIAGRINHTATLLKDGRILVAGGRAIGLSALDSAEVYDPKTGKFGATGLMTAPRYGHTATFLASGRVLITGGSPGLDSAELYDPKKGTFTATPRPMTTGRYGHTATLLPDGRVLIAGGTGDSGSNATAELYRP
jgi:hypothetical protein